MGIFKKFMFLPYPMRLNEPIIEELKEHTQQKAGGSISLKEKMVVTFLYLMMVTFIVTLLLYLIMNYQDHAKAANILDIFKYVSAILVGYFLGVNKQHE
jgi:hypothetical protein